MNELTNHGVSRAFQLLWRRRPRVAAASWCKRRYGREREWRSRVGLTECGKCGSGTSVDRTGLPRELEIDLIDCLKRYGSLRLLACGFGNRIRLRLVLDEHNPKQP